MGFNSEFKGLIWNLKMRREP